MTSNDCSLQQALANVTSTLGAAAEKEGHKVYGVYAVILSEQPNGQLRATRCFNVPGLEIEHPLTKCIHSAGAEVASQIALYTALSRPSGPGPSVVESDAVRVSACVRECLCTCTCMYKHFCTSSFLLFSFVNFNISSLSSSFVIPFLAQDPLISTNTKNSRCLKTPQSLLTSLRITQTNFVQTLKLLLRVRKRKNPPSGQLKVIAHR